MKKVRSAEMNKLSTMLKKFGGGVQLLGPKQAYEVRLSFLRTGTVELYRAVFACKNVPFQENNAVGGAV